MKEKSLIMKLLQEVVYATVKGFDIKCTDSNMYQSLRFSIQWLQVIIK
jgi:vacuolar protein sorting-associated protein 13A/C